MDNEAPVSLKKGIIGKISGNVFKPPVSVCFAVHLPNGFDYSHLVSDPAKQHDKGVHAVPSTELLTDYDRILLQFGMHIQWQAADGRDAESDCPRRAGTPHKRPFRATPESAADGEAQRLVNPAEMIVHGAQGYRCGSPKRQYLVVILTI